MPPSASSVSVHKPRILRLMDERSRHWPTIQAARRLLRDLPADVTPSQFVSMAVGIGYRLEDPELDLNHLANHWANENRQGWFGDVMPTILAAFREAVDLVGEQGPFLDVWWVHGGLPAGSTPALQYHLEDLRTLHGLNQVSLFFITVPIPDGAWPYPPPAPGEGDDRRDPKLGFLQTK